VISVGNLSFGGRGKTPLAAHIARMLVEAGERPAVLTRGYARRRREDGVVVVSDGTRVLADVDRAGDEPLMLARDVPGACVLVSEQRALAGALAERALGATVHLLDDGFQHLALARDIDLVIVTAADFTERAMPFGRLREPIGALAWADAVFEEANEPERRAGRLSFTFTRTLGHPVPLEPERDWASPDRRVVALAGIAEPARFTRALSAAGWQVVETLAFADHHRYSAADLSRLAAAAARAQAPVLTTAKDAVRLLPKRPLPAAVAYVPLAVAVQPQAAFRTWLLDRLREARP
jgi:tetraacyldisaccharide 4'-kinase